MADQRTRRNADESQQLILDAASALLASGGVAAVQMRAVARAVGMTDAGVNHHFRTRDQLLEALLRHGGRRIRTALDEVLARWLDRELDVPSLVYALAEVYRDGYADLALALHTAGFRDQSSGLLEPVVEALHQRRGDRSADKNQTRRAVAALHQAIALDAVCGREFRRSAGFSGAEADDASGQLQWWAATIETTLRL